MYRVAQKCRLHDLDRSFSWEDPYNYWYFLRSETCDLKHPLHLHHPIFCNNERTSWKKYGNNWIIFFFAFCKNEKWFNRTIAESSNNKGCKRKMTQSESIQIELTINVKIHWIINGCKVNENYHSVKTALKSKYRNRCIYVEIHIYTYIRIYAHTDMCIYFHMYIISVARACCRLQGRRGLVYI